MMNRDQIKAGFDRLNEAWKLWDIEISRFESEMSRQKTALLHEALANRMSAEQVAEISKMPVARVRTMMRQAGIDPKRGQSFLAKQSAAALIDNANLLGIDPTQMDLTSPLAYLPMGKELREALEAKPVDHVAKIKSAISVGIDVEEDWDGPSIKPGTLTDEQIEWLAAWLVGEGIK